MKLDKEALEAVLALRGDRNFDRFVGALAKEIEIRNERLVCADLTTNELLCLQGQVRFGVNLLEAITKAESAYAKHTSPRT